MLSVRVDERAEEVGKAVLDGLTAYNRSKVGDGSRSPVAVSVRDGETIVGGAVGRYWHGWVYIDLFWVSESLRGQDIGTRVMDEVEAHALKLGARGVHLTTYSWQARPFYEKRGYTVFGELSPYPDGHACFWLSKRLAQQDAVT